MPCTRSMRSGSKPSTAGSQKKKVEEQEVEPSPLKPRARTTRGKKVSKVENEETASTSKSSTVAKSTRSTRAGRSKPVVVEPEDSTSESEPPTPKPKPRVTRSTRQTGKASKASAASSKPTRSKVAAKAEQDVSDAESELAITASTSKASTSKSKKPTASVASSTKKNTRTASKLKEKEKKTLETDSCISSEEDNDESTTKILTLEQLQRYHAAPLRTALTACQDISECLAKIINPEAAKKQEEEFQRLMNSKDMPPPPVPAKGKGRTRAATKRARSRTPPPAIKEDILPVPKIPKDFNFAEKQAATATTALPANKKIIMDLPTPDEKEKRGLGENDSKKSEDKKKIDSSEASTDPDNTTSDSSGVEKTKKKKANKRNAKAVESDSDAEKKKEAAKKPKSIKKTTKTKYVIVEDESSSTEQSEDIGSSEDVSKSKVSENQQTVPPIDSVVDDKTKPNLQPRVILEKLPGTKTPTPSPPLRDEAMDVDNIFENSVMEVPILETSNNDVPVTTSITDTATPAATTDEKKSLDKTPGISESIRKNSQEEGKSGQLDRTFVMETPKEDQNNKNKPALNATYTPELFDTPTTSTNGKGMINQTVVISDDDDDEITEAKTEKQDLKASETNSSPQKSSSAATVEPSKKTASNGSSTSGNGGGVVASLVNLFSKGTSAILGSSSPKQKSRSKTPEKELPPISSGDSGKHSSKDLNSTYVVPVVAKKDGKAQPTGSAAMNVTVCLNKAKTFEPELTDDDDDNVNVASNPILPPPVLSAMQKLPGKQESGQESSACNRTFCKEPASNLAIVEEEDDEINGGVGPNSSSKEKTGNKIKAPLSLYKLPGSEKDSKKGLSSSSSSSCSSLKSASSQPNISQSSSSSSSKKGAAQPSSKIAPAYGSSSKLNDVNKSKQLEEAEKRRLEFLQKKVDQSKKKLKQDEWKKKVDQTKLEEKLKEKQKLVQAQSQQHPQPTGSSSSILKKPMLTIPGTGPSSGFLKPKNVGPMTSKFPPSAAIGHSFVPPMGKPIYNHGKAVPPPPAAVLPSASSAGAASDKDDSFKTAYSSTENRSFLDVTDINLSSYDITMYEDLDEDLNHRKNKTTPSWASDKEALKVALYSMVLVPEYYNNGSIPTGFPKPNKHYKLFPSKPS